jgi:uncharacterized membrane protein YbhN (UPF0104 family)
VLVVGAVIAAAVSHPSTVVATLRALASVHPGWLATAVAVEAVSVLAIAQQHRVLLGAAGAKRPRVGDYLAVTYVGGAVSSSLPGGPALAAAYTYRQLRARGVTEAHAVWTLAVAGMVSTAVIALTSTTLLTLAAHPTAATLALGMAEIAGGPALVALARWTARHPQPVLRFTSMTLGRFNRLRRRPADTGRDRVVATVLTLNEIQPRRRHWAAALGCAAVNWGADAACLALCLLAVGATIPAFTTIVLAYVAGVATTQLALTPAGLGMTEAAITGVLVAHGSPAHPALAAVLLFRLISPGLNAAIGAMIGLTRRSASR